MKKLFLIVFSLVLSTVGFAQNNIQFRSEDKAELIKSDFSSLRASFSFSGIEAFEKTTSRGVFSEIAMANTVIGGNEGNPQIPVINELIAIPFGATPAIRVTSYTTTDYRLTDYGIHTLAPRQPSLRKDKKPEEVPFVYNESAYQTRGLSSEPKAMVFVDGIMRGVQVGKMTIEPVSYDPVNNILRMFNDIEVEVSFDGADLKATEDQLLKTYSPYFDIVYQNLFNGRAILDIYTSHPDLYDTPVKMVVITTSTYANNTTFQNWVKWKKQKGFYTTVYTTNDTGTTSASIKAFIRNLYNTEAPTFVVIVGDTGNVTYSLSSSTTSKVTDLYYSSTTDSDLYPEMYLSRMPVSSTTELTNLLNKIMQYEQYTMPNSSYLNNTLLIAGWDSYWTGYVGKPTIQYANNNYFNSTHGINPYVYITTGSGQTTCYNNINDVGFVNYTAHGDNTMWADPQFSTSNANSLSNTNKYFWAMGNCCLAANFGYSGTCLAEALLRGANKGAFGYIGSCPETYWYEDYFFGVGATTTFSNAPAMSNTKTGVYDVMFNESSFNTLNSVTFLGNVAVSYAHAGNYESSVSDKYYWEAYHTLGDGSVMPYLNNPIANNVTHDSQLFMGLTTFTVNADAGSYVAITVNDEIIGVGLVSSSGTVSVDITPQTATGTAHIVVTRQQRQPYIQDIPIVPSVEYTITANANPAQGGTVTGSGTYYQSQQCTLTATPNTHYEFTNWKKGNSVVSTNPTYTFTVSETATYTANFTAMTLHTITCNSVQNGTISASPTSAYKGDVVTLTATPDEGFFLVGWDVRDANNNAVAVTNNQFTMPDSNVTVSATFVIGHNVTLASCSNGSISANPTYAMPGIQVALTSSPDEGYSFGGWVVYKTGDVNASVNLSGNGFVMPDYDVTVSALFALPQGGETTIGSGTTTTIGANLPTNVYYNYTTSQQIYTSTEVGEAGTIVALSFFYDGDSISDARNLDIYLTHTNATSLTTWTEQNANDRVFSGSVIFQPGEWNSILLNTPFAYDGTSNLMLTVDDNTGASTLKSTEYFRTYSTGANRAIYYRNDSNNIDPTNSSTFINGTKGKYNSQMKVSMAAADGVEALSVSPSALSGFTYAQGEGPSEAQSVALVASVIDDITVTAPAHFEVASAEDGPFASSITLSQGNLVKQNLFVRLKNGLAKSNYVNETLAIVSGETRVDVTLSGEVTEGNGVAQAASLPAGWSWWSTFIDMDAVNGLALLEDALGANGIQIKASNAFVTYDEGWFGTLASIENEHSYRINIAEADNLSLAGPLANPEEHPIDIVPGWNWIGFIEDTPMDLNVALDNLGKSYNDIIKSFSRGFATYYGDYGWWGELTSLNPGEGYMYSASASGTLVYPSAGKHSTMVHGHHASTAWKPVAGKFADNMSVIAVIDLDGNELRSDNVELGAFDPYGECRGAVKLLYVEPIDRYVAFLSVFGNNGDQLSLRVLSEGRTFEVSETLAMKADTLLGSGTQPLKLNAKGNTGIDETLCPLGLFPNPSVMGQEVRIELGEDDNVTIELFDLLGRTVVTIDNANTVIAPQTPGVYTLRVTDKLGNSRYGKLIVK